MSALNDITIDINGGDAQSRSLVGGLIQQTLSTAGFSDVTSSSETEPDSDSMLAAVEAASPELFATPIYVNMGEVEAAGADSDEESDAE